MVQWGEVPADDQNGVVLSYTVTYRALPNGIQLRKNVTPPTTQATLTDLNEYTNYSIIVFSSTAKGAGNVSAPIMVITDEDSKFCTAGIVLVLQLKVGGVVLKVLTYSVGCLFPVKSAILG